MSQTERLAAMTPPRTLAIAILLIAVTAAGCIGEPADSGDDGDPVADEPPLDRPLVVAAVIDTGINPYHETFRDDSPLAHVHPSEYLEGFPADAEALELTFDAGNYTQAVLADCETWRSVEEEKTYWIPGTRIDGAITFQDLPDEIPCEQGELPGAILDRGGHGTGAAGRLAGDGYSLCPTCRIVAVQGFETRSITWAADRSYIDLQSNSWGKLPNSWAESHDERQDLVEAAHAQPVFVAGGNGLAGFFGGSGHPAYFDNVAGSDGIVMVGGHDNGRYTPWTMTMPHVVADANSHPSADSESLDNRSAFGGTSGATPFAAGTFARTILEARRAVDDTGNGVRNGSLVVAPDDADLPEEGPLSDGELTLEEAKATFFRTANPRPVEDGRWDGERCDPTEDTVVCTLYPTTPVAWSDVPEPVPAYYFVGYGQVGNVTLPDHVAAMLGEMPVPDRPMADRFHGLDSQARRTFDEHP